MPDEGTENALTQYINVYPKSIVNKVSSPDVGMSWSLNPYQGCEHGCIYCYARNSHNYWGYSAGLDFESKILIKKNAPEFLLKKLKSPTWKAECIAISGNTDCYQPIERKEAITRRLLEIFSKHRHPVGIITKNSLVLRDIDILKDLSQYNLVQVSLSITSLDEDLRRVMEPRTASVAKRLETVEKLSEAGIPVHVMIAPIIPGLNDHEILKIIEAVGKRGALAVGHTVVRLNGNIDKLFIDWLEKNFPDRKEKVLNQIASCHQGKLNDNRFKKRMKGEGKFAEIIKEQMQLGRSRFLEGRKMPKLRTDLYQKQAHTQMSLF